MRAAAITSDDSATARFGREDRLGLGIAIGLHVLLLLALAIWEKDAPTMSEPDRIAVTVSDEIALESTSPNPSADPAPSVGAEIGEPEPPSQAQLQVQPTPRDVVEPRPALVPAPAQKAIPSPPRPAPKAATKPAPKAQPTKQAPSRGSRIGNDFLAGSGGSGSDAEQPAQKAGPLTAASLSSAISRQLRPHWTAPQGVDADKLVTVLAWEMNRDGSLKGRPRVVSQSGVTEANSAQKDRHAELAIRAVQLAAPFELPDDYYDTWKSVREFRFDRRL
ncbi:hypothetical protein EKN06_00385 [Croceicoccus ponticola]|uniref:Energy transducer TonB n=1 Tax=Croceicoccus ponticola TaxID=2217664 RepID=A0A437GZE1_9SPHN|nr:hypothetical protein [Croceicoccus ponticola]RVQ68728.1 hypothetical protein EKN06_00385 [Croceicoccus ponticola]